MNQQYTPRQVASAVLLFPFNATATVLDSIFCIPALGRGLKLLWNTVLTFPHFILGMGEWLLWQVNFQPVKKLKIGVVVLQQEDDDTPVEEAKIIAALERTNEIFLEKAKVKLVPAPHIPKAFSNQDAPSKHWIQYADTNMSKPVLEVGCDKRAIIEDLLLHGANFQWINLRHFFFTSARRVFGYGSPVTIFIVSKIHGKTGCSLGWFTDYVTIPKKNLNCIPHELGHACNLFHRENDQENLLYPFSCKPTKLTAWQIAVLRSSRHVTIL